MAHYAMLDENNLVVNVITGQDEDVVVDGITDWEAHYSEVSGYNCKRTSYNTYGNTHINGGTPYRKNYAVVGGSYDPINDAFIAPQPYASWTLDETTYTWVAPSPYPETDGTIQYYWSEDDMMWRIIPNE